MLWRLWSRLGCIVHRPVETRQSPVDVDFRRNDGCRGAADARIRVGSSNIVCRRLAKERRYIGRLVENEGKSAKGELGLGVLGVPAKWLDDGSGTKPLTPGAHGTESIFFFFFCFGCFVWAQLGHKVWHSTAINRNEWEQSVGQGQGHDAAPTSFSPDDGEKAQLQAVKVCVFWLVMSGLVEHCKLQLH